MSASLIHLSAAAIGGGSLPKGAGAWIAANGGAPIEDFHAPVGDGGAPIESFHAPIGDGGAPILDFRAPIGDGGAPILGFRAPIGDGGAPILGFRAPIGDGGAPILGFRAPIGDEGAPILDFRAPIGDEGAPIRSSRRREAVAAPHPANHGLAPAATPTGVPHGWLKRLFIFIGDKIKTSSGCNPAIGEDLGVERSASAAPPPPGSIAPDFDLRPTTDGKLEALWTKRQFDQQAAALRTR